jgi:hypothetical protein
MNENLLSYFELCKNKSRPIIEEMRHKQTMATSSWAYKYESLWDRWHVMADFFGVNQLSSNKKSNNFFQPLVTDFKYNFRPFTYLADDEFKHWLEMRDRKASCNMITIGKSSFYPILHCLGVGEVWDGERLIQKKYPQCSFLGVDPSAAVNKQLVEALPNSRFIQAALSDKESNVEIYEKGEFFQFNLIQVLSENGTYAHLQGNVVDFIEFMDQENGFRLVDFMSIDAEGAEFALLPLLHRKFLNHSNHVLLFRSTRQASRYLPIQHGAPFQGRAIRT